VPLHRLPPHNLAFVIKATSSHKVPAIPLKPTPRIGGVNPAFPAPNLKWLRCVHTEVIKLRIVSFVTKLRLQEPTLRILSFAIGHILAAKYPQLEHLFWRKLRLKIRMEILSDWLSQVVDIALLHHIVDDYRATFLLHRVGESSFLSVTLRPQRLSI